MSTALPILLIPFLLLSAPAVATASESDGVAVEHTLEELAEIQQLREELRSLSARNHWGGMVRKWTRLKELRVSHSLPELITGAHIERHVGDVAAAYDLLREAARNGGEREVIDWLWEIDSGYGRVVLEAPEGSERELEVAVMPLVPDQRACIEFAQQAVTTAGRFEGMLPAGSYVFGGHSFQVTPGPRSVSIKVEPY